MLKEEIEKLKKEKEEIEAEKERLVKVEESYNDFTTKVYALVEDEKIKKQD